MSVASTGGSRVDITRLITHCVVPADHPAPHKVKAQLDETVKKELPQTIAALLKRICPLTDERVWLIRRLDLDFAVNASWDRTRVARTWGQAIGQSLNRVLQASIDEHETLCFSSRAAYLAKFLLDCAKGWAWGRWYFQAFHGLKLLPTTAAIRTAVLDHPTTGLKALHHLDGADLNAVLAALNEQDARLLAEELAGSGEAEDESAAFRAAWTAWKRDDQSTSDVSDVWRATLRLLISASRENGAGADRALLNCSHALVCLVRRLRQRAQTDRVVSALRSGDLAALYTAAGSADGAVFASFLRCPPEFRTEIVNGVMAGPHSILQETREEAGIRHTPFGGLFLLLPLLDAIPLDEATEQWPAIENLSAAAIVRFLLFVKACGHRRAQRVFHDPLVRDVFGMPSFCTIDALLRWQRRITPIHLATFSTTCVEWQRGRQLTATTHYLLTSIETGKGAIGVLVESSRGAWYAVARQSIGGVPAMIERLLACVNPDERRETTLLCASQLIVERDALGEWQSLQPLQHAEADRVEGEEATIVERVVNAERLAEEMRYLECPRSLRLRHRLDLATTPVAQGLLRNFAGRLPGYADSRLAYLYQNFLACSATLEEELGRRVVRLGRVPLQLMLNLTGMSRATYTLSWLDGRPVVVFPHTEE